MSEPRRLASHDRGRRPGLAARKSQLRNKSLAAGGALVRVREEDRAVLDVHSLSRAASQREARLVMACARNGSMVTAARAVADFTCDTSHFFSAAPTSPMEVGFGFIVFPAPRHARLLLAYLGTARCVECRCLGVGALVPNPCLLHKQISRQPIHSRRPAHLY